MYGQELRGAGILLWIVPITGCYVATVARHNDRRKNADDHCEENLAGEFHAGT
jgi:hypothetical protein